MINVLVGGLEHGFYDFPSYWECHHPNWLIFLRGVGQPPTSKKNGLLPLRDGKISFYSVAKKSEVMKVEFPVEPTRCLCWYWLPRMFAVFHGENDGYPLVNVYIHNYMENHQFLMGKSTISMENHHFWWVNHYFWWENHHFWWINQLLAIFHRKLLT